MKPSKIEKFSEVCWREVGVKVRGVEGVGSSGEEDVWEVNSPRSGMSRFGGVCEIPSSSALSTITSVSGSGMAWSATG